MSRKEKVLENLPSVQISLIILYFEYIETKKFFSPSVFQNKVKNHMLRQRITGHPTRNIAQDKL